MDGKRGTIPLSIGVALALGLLFAAGCATRNYRMDFAGVVISQGEKAVDEARASNAALVAQPELKAAEEKLSLAKEAFAKEQHDKAARLAEEAKVAAEYAQTKAVSEKSKRAVEEMQKNIDVMRQEIERQSR